MADENAHWNSDKMTVEAKLIGDRPAGIVAMDSDRAGDPARGHVSHPGTARDLCRLVHRFEYRDVASAVAGKAATGTRATSGTSL